MATTQRIGVSLEFSANTQKVKAQLQDLQKTLQTITNMPVKSDMTARMKDQLHEASLAAADLQAHLKKATNESTGNLDFSKLNRSLKESGINLVDYGKKLQQIGPEGQKAFVQLATSVANAEIPLKRSNKLLNEFWTNLKKTAQYEVSSKILRGVESALSSAYRYAEDLNNSLNDIRIVTGYNTDQMADFAKEANKAAKALSTTTTEYTKASLIYYQQGLSNKEVKERADVTVKMANVAGTSAEKVSDQLTAVWNNFADGSKHLEYYADVMTALGAATASSTEEISTGLNKFASVAETVGLSYEYAASALATVTSTTRESADVVGTAFKTLFARIQDLELGKTLDDGTTIGQYSEALAKVGINIKEVNGNIKTMDTLLTEMAEKWDTLNKDSQVALAQNVAGVRQYTQLVALLDNWDFFQSNLKTSLTSTGELDKQAEIYAESWEAAENRVQASLETIYKKLLNDETFIEILNLFADFIDGIDYIIDRVGGLEGVLASLGTILTRVFSKQLSQSINNAAYGLKMMTESGKQAVREQKTEMVGQLKKVLVENVQQSNPSGQSMTGFEKTDKIISSSNQVGSVSSRVYSHQLEIQEQLMKNASELTEEERERVIQLKEQHRQLGENAIKQAEILDNRIAEGRSLENEAKFVAKRKEKDIQPALKKMREQSAIQAMASDLSTLTGEAESEEEVQIIRKKVESKYIKAYGEDIAKQFWDSFNEQIKNGVSTSVALDEVLAIAEGKFNEANDELDKQLGEGHEKLAAQIGKNAEETSKAAMKEANSLEQVDQSAKDGIESLEQHTEHILTWSERLVEGTNAVFSLTSALNMMESIWDTLNNPDMSGWEKFISVLSTTAMMIPTVINGANSLQKALSKETKKKIENAIGNEIAAKSEDKLNEEKKETAQVSGQVAKKTEEETRAKVTQAATEQATEDKIFSDIEINGKKYRRRKEKGKDNFSFYSVDEKGIETPISREQIGSSKKVYNLFDEAENKIIPKETPKFPETPKASRFKKVSDSVKKAGAKIGEGTKTLGGNIKNFMSGTGGAFVAVAASIAVAVLAFKQLDKVWNKDKINAEKAAEAAEKAAQGYQSTKAAYEDLQTTMDSYSFKANGLDNLIKGTDEFRKALVDANEEAYKLIKQYDNLQYSVDDDGLIVIDENSLERVKQEELKRLETTQTASMIAAQEAKNAQLKADMTQFNREIAKDREITRDDRNTISKGAAIGLGAGAATAGAFAAAGATIGSVVPIFGTLIGAGIGLAAGAIAGGITAHAINNDQTKDEVTALEKMASYYEKYGDAAFAEENKKEVFGDFYNSNKALVDSLYEEIDETEKMIKALNANTAANKAQNALLVQQTFKSNERVQSSKYKEEIEDASVEAMGILKDQMFEEMEDSGWGTEGVSKATGVNAKANKFFTEYAAAAGLSSQAKLVDTTGTDANRAFVYIDENNEKQTIYLDSMKAIVAQTRAMEKLNESSEDLIKTFNRLNSEEYKDKGGTAIAAFLANKNFMSVTKEEFEALGISEKGDLTDENVKKLTMRAGDLNQDGTLSESELSVLGVKTQEEAYQKFEDVAKETIQAWNKLEKTSNTIAGLSLQATLNLDNAAKEIDKGVVKGFDSTKFLKTVQSMVPENLDEEKKQEAYTRLSSVDWSNYDALYEVNNVLRELGIETLTLTEEKWSTFQKELRAATGATRDFTKMTSDLKTVFVELSKIKYGDLVDTKIYDSLIEYGHRAGEAWEDFFITTADGSKRFIGNQQDMIKATREKFESELSDIQKLQSIQENYEKITWKIGKDEVVAPDWAKYTEKDREMANSILSQRETNSTINELLHSLGYDETSAKDWNETQIQEFFDRLEGFVEEDYNELTQTVYESYASTTTNMIQLDNLRLKISEEAYQKQKQYIEKLAEEALLTLDRYVDIDRELNSISRKISNFVDKMEDMYGQDKIDALDDYNKLLDEQMSKLYNEQTVNRYVQQSTKANLEKTFNEVDSGLLNGLTIKYSEDGYVSNMVQIEEALSKDIDNQNSESITAFREALKLYNTSIDKSVEIIDSIDDTHRQWKQNNYEKIAQQMNLAFEKSELTIENIDYEFEEINKDFYKLVATIESGVLGIDKNFDLLTNKSAEIGNTTQALADAQRDLDSAYKAGQITQADYIAGLKEIRSLSKENIETIREMQEEFENYYENVMAKGRKEIEKEVSKIEHASSLLDYYQNLMGIIGKETDYKAMDVILKGSQKVAKDRKEAAEAELKTWIAEEKSLKLQMDQKKEVMEAAKAAYEADSKNDALKIAFETSESVYTAAKNGWEYAAEAKREAEAEMLSATADYAEASKAILENTFAQIKKDLEGSLTKGLSFDEITSQMDRASTIQEEYLTTTNKIYETTKLMRTAQNAIDNSTNEQSKKKLKAFVNETKQMQGQNKLSNFELELQQKKYDLLVAEIALQDAQNAKSTVRLTRTADGGFGYIYTADENKINEAQQQYEDADNVLYNTRLEGLNEYNQKYMQVYQEGMEAITELTERWQNGELSSDEEYYRLKAQIEQDYTEQLLMYSELRNVAIRDDSSITKEAWTEDFRAMVGETNDWQAAVGTYTDKAEEAMQDWQEVVDEVEEVVGKDLTSMSDKVDTITTAANEARDAIIGGNGKQGLCSAIESLGAKMREWLDGDGAAYTKELQTQLELLKQIKKETTGIISDVSDETSKGGSTSNWGTWIDISNAVAEGKGINEVKGLISKLSGFNDEYINDVGSLADLALKGNTSAQKIFRNNQQLGLDLNHSNIKAILNNAAEKISENPASPKKNGPGENGPTEVIIPDKYVGVKGIAESIKDNKFFSKNVQNLLLNTNPLSSKRFTESERLALFALNQQYQTGKDKTRAEAVLNNMIETSNIDITQIKKSLDFDIAKDFIKNKTKTVMVEVQDFSPLAISEGFYGVPTSKEYTVSELLDDKYLSSWQNGEERQAYAGIFRLHKKYIIGYNDFAKLIDAFDTGGYTGSWGPEGKLAMLHQKEIILNADDTANFLASLDLLHSILKTIDIQAANAQFSSSLTSSYFTPTTSETLEQNVHIEASFPGVSDHNEVELALNNIINQASQYANRK